VSQISPPIRIVLVAAIALIGAWMLFLRPKTETPPVPQQPPTAPGVKGLANDIAKAKEASKTSDAANAKIQAATGGQDSTAKAGKSESGSTASAGKLVSGRVQPLQPLSADQTKGLPRKVVSALENRQVFVIGVFDTAAKRWRLMAADERSERRELAAANRYDGKVKVVTAPVAKIAKLHGIVGDLNVTQTPSVVVVDRNRHAVVLEGYVERNAINQAIADARRNSTDVRIKDPYVRQLNRTCANLFLRMDRLNVPTTRAGVKPALRRFERLMASYSAAFVTLKGKSKYRPIARQTAVVLRKGERFGAALRSGNFARMQTSLDALLASDNGLDRKFADAGATTCVFNRTF
jgi:hypothetical protein